VFNLGDLPFVNADKLANGVIGIVQHIHKDNKLFSAVLEDGTCSVCICKDIRLHELGDLLFGGFQHYGMNFIEAETAGKHF